MHTQRGGPWSRRSAPGQSTGPRRAPWREVAPRVCLRTRGAWAPGRYDGHAGEGGAQRACSHAHNMGSGPGRAKAPAGSREPGRTPCRAVAPRVCLRALGAWARSRDGGRGNVHGGHGRPTRGRAGGTGRVPANHGYTHHRGHSPRLGRRAGSEGRRGSDGGTEAGVRRAQSRRGGGRRRCRSTTRPRPGPSNRGRYWRRGRLAAPRGISPAVLRTKCVGCGRRTVAGIFRSRPSGIAGLQAKRVRNHSMGSNREQ